MCIRDRNATVRIEPQEFGSAVLALVDADGVQGVGQAQFFEGDGDLESVGRAVGVEMDHARLSVSQGWRCRGGV